MSTRGEIHIYNCDGEQCCRIYNHSDSYPTGLGLKLMQFLQDRKITNGIGYGDNPQNASNGIEDLSAQLVRSLKSEKQLGGVYLFPQFGSISEAKKAIPTEIEYVYSIFEDGDTIKISINFGEMMDMATFENFIAKEFEKYKESIPEKRLGEALFVAIAIQTFMENYSDAGNESCIKLAEFIDTKSYLPRSRNKAVEIGQKFANAFQGQILNDYESSMIADFLGIPTKQELR